MCTQTLESKKLSLGQRFNAFMDRSRRSYYSFLALMTTATVSTAPTFCAAASMSSIFKSIAEIIYDIALYTGLGILLFALVSWILAMKDENAEGQSRAIRTAIVGIALVCFRTIGAPIINSLIS